MTDKWENIPQWTFAGWPYKRLTDVQGKIFKVIFLKQKNNKPIYLKLIKKELRRLYRRDFSMTQIYTTIKRLYLYGYIYIFNEKNDIKCSTAGIISAIWQKKIKHATNIYHALARKNPTHIRKYFTLYKEKDRIYPFIGYSNRVLKETEKKIKKAQV